MSPKGKLKLAAPTFREQLARRAQEVGLDTEHLDRALILGQLAALLSEDPELTGKIAHKGAAMLHLVNKSRRFSRDLDSGDIRGQRVDRRTVRRALSTAKAKKVVVGIDQLTQGGADSITLFLNCRRLQGGATMKIQFSINWSEPFTLPPVMESYALPDGTPVKVPVMDSRERAAEKLRAFLDRGEAPDAYDLWWYATTIFPDDQVLRLSKLIKVKLAQSNLASDLDLHARFKEMEQSAREQWAKGTGLIIAAEDKPSWTAVSKALASFKRVVPNRAR